MYVLMHAHMYTKARTDNQVSSSIALHLIFVTGSVTEAKVHQLNLPSTKLQRCAHHQAQTGLFVQDRISLCVPGYSGTQYVDYAGLELRDLLALVSLCSCIKSVRPTPGSYPKFWGLLRMEARPPYTVSSLLTKLSAHPTF